MERRKAAERGREQTPQGNQTAAGGIRGKNKEA